MHCPPEFKRIPLLKKVLFALEMHSYVVLLAFLPLCFAAPNARPRDEDTNECILKGRTCLRSCQSEVRQHFNLSTGPQDFKEFCDFEEKLNECFECFKKCREIPISALVRQAAETNAQICDEDFDERKFEGNQGSSLL